MERETEIKVEVDDADEVSRRLEALGATCTSPRALEDNRLFDLPGLPLARSGRILRVRVTEGRSMVTAKSPAEGRDDMKVRREVETAVADGGAFVTILELAGFAVVWRYQKFRREFRLGAAIVVVDEIPHGVFVEIEGEPAAIEDATTRLGFPKSRWITSSYREIHERRCRAAHAPVGDMMFPEARRA